MSNSSAQVTTDQPAPSVVETALHAKITALKTVSDMLYEDLRTYGSTLPSGTAGTLNAAIDAHANHTDAFCTAANACVPPIR